MRPERLVILFAVSALAACASPSYYYQAASGQMALMKSRQDINDYINDESSDPALAARLRTAQEIVQFAEHELSLPAGESYRSFAVTGRDSVVWNVVAAPEFSLQPKQWCFLITGCVPYRGYFDQDKAEREADRLRGKGMDVSVGGAIAYSTLGWFNDPILDSMLGLPDPQLAGTLFHELAHQRLFIKGDAVFNESFATLLERRAVHVWLGSRKQVQALRDWQARVDAADRFQDLLTETRGKLTNIYALDLPAGEMRKEKNSALLWLRSEHDRLTGSEWGGRSWFAHWFEPAPNNADLALVNNYLGGLCAFAQLFEQAGHDFDRFVQLSNERAKRSDAERTAWLKTPC